MTNDPNDPLTPASKGQVVVVGIASAVTSIAFFVFAALTIHMTATSGRIGQLPVIFLIALMLVISVGFLAVAISMFRKQEGRDSQLMGSATLNLVGGFLVVVPLAVAGSMLLTQSNRDSWLLLKILPISSLGLLAMRLARVRKKKRSVTT